MTVGAVWDSGLVHVGVDDDLTWIATRTSLPSSGYAVGCRFPPPNHPTVELLLLEHCSGAIWLMMKTLHFLPSCESTQLGFHCLGDFH